MFAPAAASSLAMARPIPLEAPVTTAVSPERFWRSEVILLRIGDEIGERTTPADLFLASAELDRKVGATTLWGKPAVPPGT
jgi:hypothetical protein